MVEIFKLLRKGIFEIKIDVGYMLKNIKKKDIIFYLLIDKIRVKKYLF